MANGTIKGISIVLGADASELTTALDKADKSLQNTQKQLNEVNKALKFNPNNVDLLRQKEELLTQKINDTKTSIENMKSALQQMDANGVSHTSEEYMRLERSIIEAESKQKQYNKELSAVQNHLAPLGQLGDKFQEVGSKMTELGNKMKTVSLYATAVATAIGALAVKSGQAADDINTLSKQTGMSTEQLQLYSRAADLVDVSVTALAKSQVRMKKNMLTASEGTGDAAKAFEKLGISVTDSNGALRDQDSVFQETLKVLGEMENETERDALAMQIFGKSASELNPLIEDMGETYSQVAQMFKDNDIAIVDQETLDKANQFNDAIDKIKATVQQALFVIGTNLAGYLAPLMEQISTKIQAFAGWIANLNPKILAITGAIAGVVGAIAPLLLIGGKLSTLIGGILPKLTPLFSLLTANPFATVAVAIGVAAAAIVAFGGDVDTLTSAISEKLATFINAFVEAVPQIVTAMSELIPKIIEVIVNNLPQIIESGVKIILALIEGIVKSIPTLVSNIPKVVTAVIKGLTEIVNQVPAIGKNIVTGLWNGISDKFSWLVSKIKSFCNSVKDSLKSFFGINSPSKWARDMIGKNIALGMAEGINNNRKFTDKAIASLVPSTVPTLGAISNSMSDAVGTAMALGNSGNNVGGEYKFTIELDGARVAEKVYKTSSRGQMIMVG